MMRRRGGNDYGLRRKRRNRDSLLGDIQTLHNSSLITYCDTSTLRHKYYTDMTEEDRHADTQADKHADTQRRNNVPVWFVGVFE